MPAWQRWLRLALASAALLLAALLLLVIETTPLVPASAPPGGAQVRAARAAFNSLRQTMMSSGGGDLLFSADELDAVTLLAGRGLGLKHSRTTLAADHVELATSIALPAGLWLNLSAQAQPASAGFPPLRLAAGDLVLTGRPARWAADAARGLLRLRGVALPPLDELVRGLTIQPGLLRVQLAGGLAPTHLVQDVLALGGGRVEEARVAALLCRLSAQQRQQPASELAVHLGRVMAATANPAATAQQLAQDHRNALVALALFTAGKSARRLVADQAMFDRCAAPPPEPVLAGRTDLAKHWAVSAALAAVGGVETSRLMGEWKELSDSMAGGSGFSFVDLAADRAGLRLGRAAVNPVRAAAVRAELAGITNEGLLPPSVLALAEGLPNDRFVARYRDTDSQRFAAAVKAIDRILAKGRTPGMATAAP
ncbi:hypothetical protein CHU93_02000 [Sandarakinorhabdus cyanobacteriorum]|uniref:Uncharacterized protein n=1 Tax=Sandarakinorhabdus cyanobacteriorum TaxID=1981098 RepID=A0A255Z0R7_9SPHN|nr:hypothetical protein [Sandarakinorhabdus cyanobacteriorum]OYQ35058.1 hypothetical protein CHU93_02000 [Sandarakinorhabdus cyanobacteriorum]